MSSTAKPSKGSAKDQDALDKDEDQADGGKAWKKNDYIPRRFDELPPEPEWTPVADVIRNQREDAAKQEREEVKIVPPSDSESDSDPQVPSPLPTGKILGSSSKLARKEEKEQHHKKGRSLQESSNKKSGRRDATTTRDNDGPDIDAVTRSMMDWALKTDYEIKRKKHPMAHEHPPRRQSPCHTREYIGGGRNQRDREPSPNFGHERNKDYREKRNEEYYPERHAREYYEVQDDGAYFYEKGERDYLDQEDCDSREEQDYYQDRQQYYHYHPDRDMDFSHSYYHQDNGERYRGLSSAYYHDREAERHHGRFEGEGRGRYSPRPNHDTHRCDQYHRPDDEYYTEHYGEYSKEHGSEHYREHGGEHYREHGGEHYREHGGEHYREHEDRRYGNKNQQHPRTEYGGERSRRRAGREEVPYKGSRRNDDVLF